MWFSHIKKVGTRYVGHWCWSLVLVIGVVLFGCGCWDCVNRGVFFFFLFFIIIIIFFCLFVSLSFSVGTRSLPKKRKLFSILITTGEGRRKREKSNNFCVGFPMFATFLEYMIRGFGKCFFFSLFFFFFVFFFLWEEINLLRFLFSNVVVVARKE